MKHFHCLPCIILSVFVLCGCSSDEDKLKEVTAFQKNAKEASDFLMQIMNSANHGSFKNSSSYERFEIVHISDPHLSDWTTDNHYKSPKNLKEAVEFANIDSLEIDAMVATGDYISNNEETTASDVSMYIKAFISFLFENNNNGTIHIFKRGTIFQQLNMPSNHIGYIQTGCLKYTVHNNVDEKDYITGFAFSGEFVADYPNCLYGKTSKVQIESVTDSKSLHRRWCCCASSAYRKRRKDVVWNENYGRTL